MDGDHGGVCIRGFQGGVVKWLHGVAEYVFSNACIALDLAGWKLLQNPNRLPLLTPPSFVPWPPSIQISTKSGKKSDRRQKINKIIR
jgi:hypothetical protein